MALLDSLVAADEAGLYYVNDARPGISRRRRGKGWSYRRPDGKPVSAAERAWIEAVVIPPAWTDVWISPLPDGHILATGRDQRGRKQYRYHPRWREVRDGNKYHRMSDFAGALPTLRERIEQDLRRRGLAPQQGPRGRGPPARRHPDPDRQRRVRGGQRVLRPDHAAGRSRQHLGGHRRVRVPGQVGQGAGHRAQGPTAGRPSSRPARTCPARSSSSTWTTTAPSWTSAPATSTSTCATLTGDTFTAKDFRTWGGSVTAAEALADMGPPGSATEAKRNVVAAIDAAADRPRQHPHGGPQLLRAPPGDRVVRGREPGRCLRQGRGEAPVLGRGGRSPPPAEAPARPVTRG